MKLKANINGVDYDLTQGITFKEEYNETLDSGSIIIPQVKEIDLKPFTSVFIHSTDKEYRGYANRGDIVPIKANSGILNITTGSLKPGTYNLAISMERPAPDFWKLSDEGIDIWAYYYFNFNDTNENQCRFLPTLEFNITTGTSDSDSETYTYHLATIDNKYHGAYNDRLLLIRNNNLSDRFTVYFDKENNILSIPYEFYDLNTTKIKKVLNITLANAYYQLRENNKTVFIAVDKEIKDSIFDTENIKANIKVLYNGWWYDYEITNVIEATNKNQIRLYIKNKIKNDEQILYLTFDGEQYLYQFESKNQTGVFNLIDNIKVENVFVPLKENTPLPMFFKHMLIDNFTEEVININEDIKTYKIALMSETKALEKIQTPNISITQSLNVEKRRSCWFYLQQFVNLYSPKIKVVYDEQKQLWEYKNKYKLDDSVKEIFENVNCPEMSLSNPTLKDILTKIMVVKDCIPYVKNNVIYAMDLTQRKGEFNPNLNVITSITGTMSSEAYTTTTRREYSQAISQESSGTLIEYLGFRNSDTSLLTLENLRLETRFPIYKINKLLLCYYKKVNVLDENNKKVSEKVFLCKQDITKLILQSKVRNALSKDWQDFEFDPPTTIDEMAQYRICTLGYEIGSTYIAGWGESYTYPMVWMDKTKTYIENILDKLDDWYIFGTDYVNNFGLITENIDNFEVVGTWKDNLITPLTKDNVIFTEIGAKIKSLFFEIDYNPLYDGAIRHSKDNYVDDEITTNDNSSSALSVLEIDGLFEKEKINRLGNKIYRITCRYNNLEELEQNNHILGSVYKDDIIIYSKEIQIYDNGIFATYFGTKDYVLKNFYTSVFAKLRTYNFMTYDESVSRSENVKKHILLSPNNYYYESDTIDNTLLLTAFNQTPIPEHIDLFNYPNKINCGFFTIGEKSYLSDINSFVCGYSLCFNIKMYDNVSGGVYISEFAVDEKERGDARGTHQKWDIVVSDNEDAFIENIGAYVCHIENDDLFKEKAIFYNDQTKLEVDNVYKNVLFKMPYFDLNQTIETNVIGGLYNICKDNKEVLNYTFQYETYSINNDILYSQWLMKLSDLLATYNKWEEDFEIVDTIGVNDKVELESFIKEEYKHSYGISHRTTNFYLKARFTDDMVNSMTPETYFNQSIIRWKNQIAFVKVKEIKVKLTKFTRKIDNNNIIIEAKVWDLNSTYITQLQFQKQEENVWQCTFTSSFETLSENSLPTMWSCVDSTKQLYIYKLSQTYNKKHYYKNMFVFTSNEYLRKTLVYDELNPNKLPSNITDTGLKVSQVFTTQYDDNNIPHISVDTSLLPSEAKSVQYWYLDKDGLLKFVFGVNLTENMSKIYISTLENRNLKVYDYLHNHIGNVSNLVEDNEKNEKLQHYTLKK